MTDDSTDNVVRLFFDEADLEAAWTRFDRAMLALHALYELGADSNESCRRRAAVEAAEAEVEFRRVFARVPQSQLMQRA